MNAKELVSLVQKQANAVMGKYARSARLSGGHKYSMGSAKSRSLAAVILRSRRKSARRPARNPRPGGNTQC